MICGDYRMRTTVNIDKFYKEKLEAALKKTGIHQREMISLMLDRLTKDIAFEAKPYETVKYQESDPDIQWKTMHITYYPVFYEKAQDLKRNFKFSVSWFITYAIANYLDSIVGELLDSTNNKIIMDNYDHNFIHIIQNYGNIKGFLTLWGVPDIIYINRLLL
jgi:hypothetical protein